MVELAAIEREVRSLAARIGAGADLLPTFGRTQDFARPNVEVDGVGLHWVVVERGEELERATFQDIEGLLERVLNSVTFEDRVRLTMKLRRGGQTDDDAWRNACLRYPLPVSQTEGQR